LIPKTDRKAIYTHLFREGVLVAQKDFNKPKHGEVDTKNLYVIKACQSLTSRGFLKTQFSWQWYYYTLTPEGLDYLREWLHLPAEIVPQTHVKQQRSHAPPRGMMGGEGGGDRERRGGGRGGPGRGDREGGYASSSDIPFGSDCTLLTIHLGTAVWAIVAIARRKAASAARLSVPRSVTARVVTVRVAVMADVAASVVAVALHPRLRRLGMRMPGRLRSRLSHP